MQTNSFSPNTAATPGSSSTRSPSRAATACTAAATSFCATSVSTPRTLRSGRPHHRLQPRHLRLQHGRAHHQEPNVLLHQLRRPRGPRGGIAQNPGAHRRAARHGDQSGGAEAAGADARRQRFHRQVLHRPHAAQPQAEPVHRPHRPQLLGEGFHVRQLHINRDSAPNRRCKETTCPGTATSARPIASCSRWATRTFSRPRSPTNCAPGSTACSSISSNARHGTPASFRHHLAFVGFPQHQIASSLHSSAASPASRRDAAIPPTNTTTRCPGSTGKQSIRAGVEIRHFDNNNFNGGTGGVSTSAQWPAFLAGTPNSATETALPANPALGRDALTLSCQDDIKVTSKLTLNSGLRWEYNGVPQRALQPVGHATSTI